jgi:hypothetical protein
LGPPRNVSFTHAELKSFTGATVPDLIAEGVRLLFVGVTAYREIARAAGLSLQCRGL